jgi:membrane protein implicated in regulation of membrane protease activity
MTVSFVFWHWWSLGAFLLIVELLAPGMFFLWMAESAFVVGLLLLLWPELGWRWQVVSFSLLSLASIGVFRWYLKKHPVTTDHPLLNRRAERYVGRVFTLENPIVNGQGRVRVDDSSWRIEGEDCASGTKVRVSETDGVILRVRRLE